MGVNLHDSIGLTQFQTAAFQESIDGIHTVDGGVPCLGTFLLQEPALHLLYRLTVVGCEALQGLDGYGLCRDLIVIPGVACTRGVIVTAQFLAEYGIFLQRLCILQGALGFWLREDDGRKGFLVNGLRLDIFLHQVEQVLIGGFHVSRQLSSVEGTEIEPLERLETGERYLMAFFLLPHKLKGT